MGPVPSGIFGQFDRGNVMQFSRKNKKKDNSTKMPFCSPPRLSPTGGMVTPPQGTGSRQGGKGNFRCGRAHMAKEEGKLNGGELLFAVQIGAQLEKRAAQPVRYPQVDEQECSSRSACVRTSSK